MKRTLLHLGGAANAFFLLFHGWLGWRIWHWTPVPAGVRGLLEMFNLGSALFTAFLAFASLWRAPDLLASPLGRSVCWLAVLFYGTRAAGEFAFSARVNPAILVTCLTVAALYLTALLPARATTRGSRVEALRAE